MKPPKDLEDDYDAYCEWYKEHATQHNERDPIRYETVARWIIGFLAIMCIIQLF